MDEGEKGRRPGEVDEGGKGRRPGKVDEGENGRMGGWFASSHTALIVLH